VAKVVCGYFHAADRPPALFGDLRQQFGAHTGELLLKVVVLLLVHGDSFLLSVKKIMRLSPCTVFDQGQSVRQESQFGMESTSLGGRAFCAGKGGARIAGGGVRP
jgi:hypothetical protein